MAETDSTDTPAIRQHPLAYLLGLEGVALLRAFAGEYGEEFTAARMREIAALLGNSGGLGGFVNAHPISTRDGYAGWATTYDDGSNQLIDLEQPIVREILDGLPPGIALDAACGTGRHSAYLAALGHTVIGVDASPEMLAVARRKVPDAEFREGDIHELPLPAGSMDLVVCALALSHFPDLDGVLTELVRVLRPGGHLVLSDLRGLIGEVGLPLIKPAPDGSFGYMPVWIHRTSDYLAAALRLGLVPRRCEEPRRPSPIIADDGTDPHDDTRAPDSVPGRPPDIWALHPLAMAAANAAWRGTPATIVLHFQRDTLTP
jgi:SAM-dependent methyltransferase